MEETTANRKRIILSGGGTLGSVMPLLAIAKKYPANYLWVGSENGPEFEFISQQNIKYQAIKTGKWRRYFSLQNFTDITRWFRGIIQAHKIISEYKPHLVLTAGSFVSVPLAMAARWHRVPVVVHQQDLTLGLANKIMTPLATKISVTFPEQARMFPLDKVVVTGNPVRSMDADYDKPIILITGGGLGARGLNDFMLEFLPFLAGILPVYHILGRANLDQAPKIDNYFPLESATESMIDLLSRAQIIISRAGMSLITEAAAMRKALVLVPIPHSHQEQNADWFSQRNAALSVKQGQRQIMDRYLTKLLRDQDLRIGLGNNLYNLYPSDATNNYIKLINSIFDTYGTIS